jgi:hypothetical protein
MLLNFEDPSGLFVKVRVLLALLLLLRSTKKLLEPGNVKRKKP